jgi:hypothetical protein
MPYHDPARPYVNYWFASADAPELKSFNSMVSERQQDRLASERGACIIYTHLACGFYVDGKINPGFRSLMERMSKMNGWFVPVRVLLDYLLERRACPTINECERNRLERRWLKHKIFRTCGRS